LTQVNKEPREPFLPHPLVSEQCGFSLLQLLQRMQFRHLQATQHVQRSPLLEVLQVAQMKFLFFRSERLRHAWVSRLLESIYLCIRAPIHLCIHERAPTSICALGWLQAAPIRTLLRMGGRHGQLCQMNESGKPCFGSAAKLAVARIRDRVRFAVGLTILIAMVCCMAILVSSKRSGRKHVQPTIVQLPLMRLPGPTTTDCQWGRDPSGECCNGPADPDCDSTRGQDQANDYYY